MKEADIKSTLKDQFNSVAKIVTGIVCAVAIAAAPAPVFSADNKGCGNNGAHSTYAKNCKPKSVKGYDNPVIGDGADIVVSTIVDSAGHFGVDPAAILAVVLVEHGGVINQKIFMQPNSNGSGALGLVQFMPITVLDLVGKHHDRVVARVRQTRGDKAAKIVGARFKELIDAYPPNANANQSYNGLKTRAKSAIIYYNDIFLTAEVQAALAHLYILDANPKVPPTTAILLGQNNVEGILKSTKASDNRFLASARKTYKQLYNTAQEIIVQLSPKAGEPTAGLPSQNRAGPSPA